RRPRPGGEERRQLRKGRVGNFVQISGQRVLSEHVISFSCTDTPGVEGTAWDMGNTEPGRVAVETARASSGRTAARPGTAGTAGRKAAPAWAWAPWPALAAPCPAPDRPPV